MAIAVNDVIKVAVKFVWDNVDEILNVYHLKTIGKGTTTDAEIILAILTILDGVYGNIQAHMSNKVSADSIEFYNVTQDVPISVESWPGFAGGTGTGSSLPIGTASLVTFPTQAKRTYGRKFIPGLLESDQDAGVIASAWMSVLALNWATFLNAVTHVNGFEGRWGVWSDAKARFTWLNECLVRNQVAYQRRRKPGVGS